MPSSDDDFGYSSGDEAALQSLMDSKPPKRKLDQADIVEPSKRPWLKYPTSSSLARCILKERFGLESFRLEQEAVISRLLEGGNSAVVFPTGGGKSLCYQVPALAFAKKDAEDGTREPEDAGLTIVVSPLIALMKDQVDALQKKKIYAVAMDSTKTRAEFLQINADLKDGKIRLLYCAPERLNNEGFTGSLRHVRGGIRLVAVDEAHCISEWGHSFSMYHFSYSPQVRFSIDLSGPDYLKIARFVQEIRAERVICLTATATPTVAEDICRAFDIEKGGLFRTAMYRPNLRLLVKVTKKVGR